MELELGLESDTAGDEEVSAVADGMILDIIRRAIFFGGDGTDDRVRWRRCLIPLFPSSIFGL
ncbi:hypothetical protein QQ056_07775 [Oscillatoria laete-virens NRMC-F 0139]|nr:hypothetical protein [Oscillatoria laete-virens]MDL5053439.1 hypothetical protein [Oscillatoria laete-virens NRMC-F 0139]